MFLRSALIKMKRKSEKIEREFAFRCLELLGGWDLAALGWTAQGCIDYGRSFEF